MIHSLIIYAVTPGFMFKARSLPLQEGSLALNCTPSSRQVLIWSLYPHTVPCVLNGSTLAEAVHNMRGTHIQRQMVRPHLRGGKVHSASLC